LSWEEYSGACVGFEKVLIVKLLYCAEHTAASHVVTVDDGVEVGEVFVIAKVHKESAGG